jgi:hypothetical protein
MVVDGRAEVIGLAAVGDFPYAVLIPEHQGGPLHGDDHIVVAGDPALVPLDLEDIADL